MGRRLKFDQMDFEITFFERLLEKKPDFIEAMEALADLYTKRGAFTKGLILDEKIKKIKPYDPIVYYNLACSYSLLNEIDKALDTIQRAIKLGYDDLRHLEIDPDLENLRKDNRFQKLIRQIIIPNKQTHEPGRSG